MSTINKVGQPERNRIVSFRALQLRDMLAECSPCFTGCLSSSAHQPGGTAPGYPSRRGRADCLRSEADDIVRHRHGGRTALGNPALLLSKCGLPVSNVTGVSQLVLVLKTPSLMLLAVPDDDRGSARDQNLHKTLKQAMNWKADEVLLQAERHLKEVYSHAN